MLEVLEVNRAGEILTEVREWATARYKNSPFPFHSVNRLRFHNYDRYTYVVTLQLSLTPDSIHTVEFYLDKDVAHRNVAVTTAAIKRGLKIGIMEAMEDANTTRPPANLTHN
jgi:hypothetical protein